MNTKPEAGSAAPVSNEDLLRIWERSIETQMHFAELSIKMRQIGLTLAGATLALAVVLYRSNLGYSIPLPLCGLVLPISSILTLAAAFILYAAQLIDVGVYHRMLRGAVRFNEMLECQLDERVCWRSGLTEAISAYSRFNRPQLESERKSGIHWTSGNDVNLAGPRIEKFYQFCIWTLVVAAISLAVAANLGPYSCE